MVFVNDLMDRSFSGKFELALDTAQQAAALEEWTANKTGPLTYYFGGNALVFGKDETTYDTDAFKALDDETQKFIRNPGVPHFEIATVSLQPIFRFRFSS